MDAKTALNLANHSKAISYITTASMSGKTEVNIPIEYVDRSQLQSLGYKVGSINQRSEYCNVSWGGDSFDQRR